MKVTTAVFVAVFGVPEMMNEAFLWVSFASDAIGGVVATGLGGAVHRLGVGALRAADGPAVPFGQLDARRFILPAVLAFGVHQHEARGVPQLVAEVAVALAAVQVEVEADREA